MRLSTCCAPACRIAARSMDRWRKSCSTALQYLNDTDVRAMAVYLKSLGQGTPPAREVTAIPAPESSLLLHFGQTVYEAHCAICHASDGRGMPPAVSAAGGQSVDSDAVRGEPDPHGAERRLPAGHARQPEALWHAALRATPVRRRGRRGRHVYTRRLGQPRQRRYPRAMPISCARHLWIDAAMLNSDPTGPKPAPTDASTRRSHASCDPAPGARSHWPASRRSVVVAIWFAFYLLVFVPRAGAP